MSVFTMEAQCMKTIMMHLLHKSDFILSDHKTHCIQIFAVIPAELAKSEDFYFSCIKLALQRVASFQDTQKIVRSDMSQYTNFCGNIVSRQIVGENRSA